MNTPMFSIVVINYNYARFLHESIGSALAQTYSDVEVIVVDDASVDDSRAVIESYGDRVTKVFKSSNRGHGDGFNQGFAASRGDVVLFLDADDYLYPECIEELAKQLQADVAVYQWRMDLVDEKRRRLDSYPAFEIKFDEGNVRPQLARCGRFATTVTSGLAFSRRSLQRVLPMDPEAFRQGGDGYLVTVAPLFGPVKTVEGVLSAYRLHASSHSQFGAEVAKRARWRLAHDEARINALRMHAAKTGLVLGPELLLCDLEHLTERIASLRLDPDHHPYRMDTPIALASRGFRSTLATDFKFFRKLFVSLWWMVAAVAPSVIARRIILWRLYSPSRPKWVDRVAKFLRRFFLAVGG